MSRVAVMVCGLAVLAAVTVPMQSFYDDRYQESMTDSADRLSLILDEFWSSEADSMTIRGWEVLPSSESSLEIEGHELIIRTGDCAYRSLMSKSMERVHIGYSDEVTINK
jgi:hypothetical protein